MSRWRKKRTVMRRYDKTARIYDMRYAEEQAAKIKAALKRMKIERHRMTLDVGCGTGVLFDYVADKVDVIVGLDFSEKNLLLAKRRLCDKNLSSVYLVRADADSMPFGNNVFDQVFAVTILQNTPNPSETLKEIRRVAKEEALFVITGLKKIFTGETFKTLLKTAHLKPVMLKDEKLKCHVALCTSS